MANESQKNPGLTVGQLRKAIEGVPDELEIIVRVSDDALSEDEEDVYFCGGILHASVEHAHDEDDTAFLAIDCSAIDDNFSEEEE